MKIEQPWSDGRLKIGSAYIGCVTKENADMIMELQRDAERYRWLRMTAVERSEYEDAKFIPCPVLVMTFIGVFDDDRKNLMPP